MPKEVPVFPRYVKEMVEPRGREGCCHSLQPEDEPYIVLHIDEAAYFRCDYWQETQAVQEHPTLNTSVMQEGSGERQGWLFVDVDVATRREIPLC